MNLPTNFRGIMRLAKKHGVKLTRGATMNQYRDNKKGCVLVPLALENNFPFVYKLRELWEVVGEYNENPNPMHVKILALEGGFEGRSFSWYENIVPIDNLFRRYYNVGKRVYEASMEKPQ